MSDETVITELIIDARQAEVGSAAYVKAMKAAQNAVDKVIEREQAATAAIEKQTMVMTGAAGSISSTAKAWDRFKASVDPVFAATQRMERALLTADAAAKKLGVDQVEINRVMDLARAKHLGTAVAVEEGAQAAKMGATQWAALGHSARSAAESIAMGQSPMMVLTQQANHLSYAMSGPQGLIAASAGVRTAFGTWLTTLPGMLSAAGVAAVAAAAVYMAATREKILSVDEILEGHKKLLDEVANTYPHLTEALKKYADEAAKLPGSVIAADTATQIKNDQASLSASLEKTMVDLRDLARAPDVVGTAGAEAFGKLADTIAAGNVDVDKLVASVGDLRLDPTLTPDARHFADGLQAAANEAKKLQDTLDKDQGIKRIGPDGQKATQTLAEVSAGFKDVSSNAGTADATIAKLFGDASAGASSGFGVSKSLQSTLGQFEQIDQAVQRSRQNQLQSMLGLEQQFRNTTTQIDLLKEAISTAGGKENMAAFFDDTSKIKDASSEITNATSTVTKLFDALNSGGTSAQNVASGLDMIRQSLVQDGFGVEAVNKFIDSLVRTRMQLDADVTGAKQLHAAIQAIQDRTINITVVTRQVGTGTKSIYDVGTSGGIGVTRYGGDSNMTQQAYPVSSYNGGGETSGYGSSYGVSGGTSTVGVTRFSNSTQVSSTPIFNTSTNSWGYVQPTSYQDPAQLARANAMYPQRAAGGPISPSSPYWVGEHGPELVVPKSAATVIPNAQSMALANPQSAFTGQVATRETDRMWQLFMNIEANTRKTYEGVDKWGSSSSYSSSGGSSGAGSSASGGTERDPQYTAYLAALKTARSNAQNVSGIIGYGAQGLSATPQQIAHRAVYGFSTGGVMGPGNGDTQKVEFFKKPSERAIIVDDDQYEDRRSGSSRSGGSSPTVIINQTNNWNGNAPPTEDSTAEVRRKTALGTRDALGSLYGR